MHTSRRQMIGIAAATVASVGMPGGGWVSVAAQGLKGDDESGDLANSWVSAGYGMSVSWADGWEVMETDEATTAVSIPETEHILLQPAAESDLSLFLSVYGHHIASVYGSPEDALDAFEASFDLAALEERMFWATEVALLALERTDTELAAVISSETGAGTVFEVRNLRISDDEAYVLDVSLSLPAEIFADWYHATQAEIQVDGDAPLPYFPADAVTEYLADATSQQSRPDEDEDEDPDTDSDDQGDDTALSAVRAHLDELSASMDEFIDLISVESLSQSQADRANDILALWSGAPSVAAEVDLGSGYRDIEQAYTGYTGTMAATADAFYRLITPDATDADVDQAAADFQDGLNLAATEADDLDTLLTEAGA